MIQNDIWIKEMAAQGMISPFEPQLMRRVEDLPVISYGLSSYGYDIRLSTQEFRIFRHIPGTVVDPKNFNPDNLEPVTLHEDNNGQYFILPAHSYGLGVALEKLSIPDNITVLCIGKSTYARCFRGDTRVALVDGSAPTLEEMAHRADKGEQFWGYSIGQHGRLIVTLLEKPRYIGKDSLIGITLDNGRQICCTPDHLFMTRDGRMVAAGDLKPNDSLMPLYRQLARGYEMVYQPLNGHLYPTHRLSDEWNLRHLVYHDQPETHRHHLDHNRLNNNPWNIRPFTEVANNKDKLTEIISKKHFSKVVFGQRDVLENLKSTKYEPSFLGEFTNKIQAFRGKSTNKVKNHKVASIQDLPGIHDVYCLTVPEAGNFALDAGVFVHNCGIIANLTPAEAGWRGHLTLEFSNSSSADCRIYANEGVVQLLFLEGEDCEVSYQKRRGKYQDQPENVVVSRV